MTDDTSDWHRAHRRTTLKIAGVACASLAAFSGAGAAHPDNSNGKGENKNENKGGGKGKWCCGCPVGDQQGKGYERNHPHEDDETRWDDWQPGDGKPPWAGEDDDEDEDSDEDEDEDGQEPDEPEESEDPPEPGAPDNPGEGDDEDDENGDGSEDGDEDQDEGDSSEPDEDDDTSEEPGEDGGGDDTPDDTNDDEDGTEDDTDGDDGDGDDGSDSPEDGDESDDQDSDDSDNSEDQDDPTASLAAQIEARVHEETNAYREEQDAPELEQSEDLAAVARSHSEDMAEQDYFDHDSPDGRGPGDRLNEAGVDCNGWGENIAWEQSARVTEGEADSIADSVVEGWINSPGHRQNLLGNYSDEGIGVAVLGDQVYVTQVFCNLSS